ncbi:MAG TPA: MFS transporter [Methanocorpusculum sp.]|nr:MFS transporter [Methanocorpusculum sp.]
MKLEHTSVLLLAVIFIAVIMDGLDGSIVNVALPVIAQAFSTDTGTVSWVSISYLLIVAGTILLFGSIAARGHIKKMMIAGFILFGGASALCGGSPTLEILIAARVLQGIGASMLMACAPIICVKYLPSKILGLSFAILTAGSSIGFAAGPAIGGIITHYLSWNWIFYINIPIALTALFIVIKAIPKSAPQSGRKFDTPGAVLLFIFMASGAYALERFPHQGAADPQILIFGMVSLISLVFFIIRECRCEYPVLNLRVFVRFRIAAIFAAYLLIQVVYASLIYLPPFYLSNQAGLDTLASGLFLLIPAGISAIVSIPIGRWSDRSTARRPFCIVSCVFLCIAFAVFAVIRPEWGIIPLVAALVCMGLCIAFESGPATSKCVELLPDAEKECGSTLTLTCVYAGAVAGTALFAAVFTMFTAEGGVVLSFAELPGPLFLSGYHATMLIGLGISVICTVLMAIVPDAVRK